MTTAAAVQPTLIFQAEEILTRRRFEVHAITGKNARYEVRIDGTVEHTIVASRAWKREQREAIEWAEHELGWKDVTGQPNIGPLAEIVIAPKAISPRRFGQMVTLWAEIAREKGYAETAERLLALGRAHAEIWASLGREAFDREMARLQEERCEQEEGFDIAAREKVTYY
ncbi:MAG: hypothetical protein HGA45_21500 [Chloroflexales bacterium]|nr:hypothetical protein [Chloroflexales bacterium]